MMYSKAAALVALARYTCAQQAGHQTAEEPPSLQWQLCNIDGSCNTQNGSVVIDSNWRPTYKASDPSISCFKDGTWNGAVCSGQKDCAVNCALDGVDSTGYTSTYGVTADVINGGSLTLNFVTPDPTSTNSPNIGSRMYMLDSENKDEYYMFNLLGQEFSFDVNVENLDCGVNGALYFASMDSRGSIGRAYNSAGAKYGTGYVDSQCSLDLKFPQGVANYPWDSSTSSGHLGVCGFELDIWEANIVSTAMTAHNCINPQYRCGGLEDCDGQCDPTGCDFNPYRLGNTEFYGNGKTIDTSYGFTVRTQFIQDDKTGLLTDIRRSYIQGGRETRHEISNPPANIQSVSGNSLNDAFCSEKNTAFNDKSTFHKFGGMAGLSKVLEGGMVLVMSVWDDKKTGMDWLDSTYGPDPNALGAVRGSCPPGSGVPSVVETKSKGNYVTFSNIKLGPIGSASSQ